MLHGRGNVAVGVEGESCGVVTQQAGECFHIYTILEGQCRECVAKLVEAENDAILVEVENRT